MYQSDLSPQERAEKAQDLNLFKNLDYWIRVKDNKVKELHTYILSKFLKLNPTKESNADTYLDHIERLVANLYYSYRHPLEQWVKLDLNENHFTKGALGWSYTALKALLDFLREAGWVEWVNPSHNAKRKQNFSTRIKAAAPLIRMFGLSRIELSMLFVEPQPVTLRPPQIAPFRPPFVCRFSQLTVNSGDKFSLRWPGGQKV